MRPTYTAELFAPLYEELGALLDGLGSEEWELPTVAGSWRVRDVAAHLVDGDLRKLAVYRDGYQPATGRPIATHEDLVGYLNELNAGWIQVARRLSPRLLRELLDFTGPRLSDLMMSLPPYEKARFPVGWAGEAESQNWFDIGREYTERWHHQMQIRDAVGAAGLLERRWIHPLLDLSLRALPRAYRSLEAPVETALVVRVVGDTRDSWSLVREAEVWRLYQGAAPSAVMEATMDADCAWRLLYNALTKDEARMRIRIEGDAALAEPLFHARSVMM